MVATSMVGAATMLMLSLLMLLIGCVLGLRFKVLILLPTIAFVWMVYLTVGLARSDGISAILVGGMLAAICLQVGYLVGAMIQHGPLMSRATKMPRSLFHAEKLR
jgi:hypothetical protein